MYTATSATSCYSQVVQKALGDSVLLNWLGEKAANAFAHDVDRTNLTGLSKFDVGDRVGCYCCDHERLVLSMSSTTPYSKNCKRLLQCETLADFEFARRKVCYGGHWFMATSLAEVLQVVCGAVHKAFLHQIGPML